MSIYENGFDAYGIKIAQVLLIEDDFAQRRRYLSLRNTLNKLIELGVIPVINQNDTVSTLELETLYKDAQVSFSDDDKEYTNDERGKMRKLSSLRSFYNYYFKNELIETNCFMYNGKNPINFSIKLYFLKKSSFFKSSAVIVLSCSS